MGLGLQGRTVMPGCTAHTLILSKIQTGAAGQEQNGTATKKNVETQETSFATTPPKAMKIQNARSSHL